MTKTAFVYDKWLSSLGGGEVVACNFATTLRDLGYKTTFICGQLIDPTTIEQKLNINMSKIDFVQAFNDETKIKEITKGADIFINASFWDYSLSLAKKQYYYTSFPGKPEPASPKKLIKSLLMSTLSRIIIPVEKISENQYVYYSLKPNRHYTLRFTLFIDRFSKTELESFDYSLDNAKIISQKVSVNHNKNLITFVLKVIANSDSIVLGFKNKEDSTIKFSPKSLFLSSKLNRLSSFLRSGNFPDLLNRVKKFDLVLANSQYTSSWIKNYWGTDSKVLYPPVDLIKPGSKINKQNKICSVGRFFTLGHGKKQEVMIEAFKKMCDQGLKGWELHLAGGLGNEPTSQAYAKTLTNSAKGYPIFLHFNKPRKFIEELYLSSKIYWHAAGFGEDQDNSPIKFEHFGIAPIEAISAGCVPVLFNGGGLPEIVNTLRLDPQIHLFTSLNDLVSRTRSIIDNKITLPSKMVDILESNFGLPRFKKELVSLLKSH